MDEDISGSQPAPESEEVYANLRDGILYMFMGCLGAVVGEALPEQDVCEWDLLRRRDNTSLEDMLKFAKNRLPDFGDTMFKLLVWYADLMKKSMTEIMTDKTPSEDWRSFKSQSSLFDLDTTRIESSAKQHQ